jgi:hypothetical protein
MNLVQRLMAPVPDFFKKLRTMGIVLGSIGAVVAAAPVALPAVIVHAAGYLAVAGGVLTAVSQAAVKNDP